MTSRPVYVTQSFLPPFEEYSEYLKRIWQSNQLTNQGPLLNDFEMKMKSYLDVDNFQFLSNGTIALQLALEALDIKEGEIITTPFSYVATTSAILWQRCKPVFVDISPSTLNIDPELIERSITKDTKAILPVHVFGNPCDVDAIQNIANRHGLKVIYDAAHAFGVRFQGKSLLDYGDISICSFHATKLFHTIEGGAILTKEESIAERVDLLKRFGHRGDDHHLLGINAKASEFQAAMGLCNLKYVDRNIQARKEVSELYDKLLGDGFQRQTIVSRTDYNYSYYPVILKDENAIKKVIDDLKGKNIFPRRYFYPALNTLPYLDEYTECEVAERIAKRILCLPLYPNLEIETLNAIASTLIKYV